MKYAKIVNKVVVQVQPYTENGFIEAPDDVVCGQINENGTFKSIPVKESYIEKRARAYKPVGEQLDDFWHAMDKGVFPKVEPFYSDILAVKTMYPKV